MKKILSAILIYSFVLLMAAAPQARAEGTVNVSAKRAMIVAKSSLYGFGGGLVVGLASQAFKKNTKNIFLFGSLGFYAGIILGVYVISTSSGPAPYEGPDTYEDFGYRNPAPMNPAPMTIAKSEAQNGFRNPEIQVNLLSLSF